MESPPSPNPLEKERVYHTGVFFFFLRALFESFFLEYFRNPLARSPLIYEYLENHARERV